MRERLTFVLGFLLIQASFCGLATADFRCLTLEERFGVAHPEQIVSFDLDTLVDPARTWLEGPDGKEEPYQLLENGKKVAVRTDLPARAKKTWKLMTGRAPASVTGGVAIITNQSRNWYEITNGLTGVRIPITSGPDPMPLALVQGVLLRSGAWLTADPTLSGTNSARVRVSFIERGPLLVVAEVAYGFGKTDKAERYYRCTISVEAGQPSLLFEEESNVEVSYRLPLNAINPTQARYRGHHSTSKEAGHEADGRRYQMSPQGRPMDAFVDLQFNQPQHYRELAIWDPWVFDSGWYWQVYDATAPTNADLAGIFAGKASRAMNPARSGVHLFTAPGKQGACFIVTCKPDRGLAQSSRFQWGLFCGSKADLAPPIQVQPIARQMNLHAGINLDKIHRLIFDFPDPPNGYGSPYMDCKAVQKIINHLRTDKSRRYSDGYYGYLYHADPYLRDLIDLWADDSGEKLKPMMAGIRETARDLLNALVNEDGIYTFRWHYWLGGSAMTSKLLCIDQVLASPIATAEEKAEARAVAVLFAAILWDNDFVPMDNSQGINLGNPNMPVAQSAIRDQFALLLCRHPMMRGKADGVVARTARVLAEDINPSGAHIGSVHYVSAGMKPTLAVMLQLKAAGIKDFFKDEERMAKFAEFYLNCVTPAEPRFGNLRKLVSIGDGSTESSELFGEMGTGFAGVKPRLSQWLMNMWRDQGKNHSRTLLMIDESLPGSPVALGSANFPGYFSVLRDGWGSTNETAVWFVNGDHYYDHCHEDLGEVVIYALGAPLSLDWGSMYYPQVKSAFMHNVALPEQVIGQAWDQDSPSLGFSGKWGTLEGSMPALEDFHASGDGGWARANFKSQREKFTWRRSVSLAKLRDGLPVIAIQDSYSGDGASSAKVFTLNLTAEGSVGTPAGEVTPPQRIWGYEGRPSDKQELPSAGQVFPLPAGINQLHFTGQSWRAHATKGIDWDVYVIAAEVQQVSIGNWAHAWHPSTEANEFQKANGCPFQERQHILRVRGQSFKVVIVPYFKGQRPKDLMVKQDGDLLSVSSAGKTVTFNADGSFSTNGGG